MPVAAFGRGRMMVAGWRILRQGCYANLRPHPGYKWQHFGSVVANPIFPDAAVRFLEGASTPRDSTTPQTIEWPVPAALRPQIRAIVHSNGGTDSRGSVNLILAAP